MFSSFITINITQETRKISTNGKVETAKELIDDKDKDWKVFLKFVTLLAISCPLNNCAVVIETVTVTEIDWKF